MDASGNNRYELLFMDEESGALPTQKESAVSKKKTNAAPAQKNGTTIAKKNVGIEKENKSGALNRNDAVNKSAQVKPERLPGTALNRNRVAENDRQKVAPKSQNGEVREQRNVRRNVRDGEFGNEQREPRQFRDRDNRGPPRNRDGEFGNEQREPRQFRDRDNRGPPRNRDSAFRGGKREFDRQSGSDKTGVKSVDKRDGAGAHNWGSVKEEIDDINKSTNDTDAVDKEESSNEQTPEQPAAQDEDEVKELTLDEWKALRGERSKPQYNIRKANEGEDTSQWKKMVVLNKKKDGDSEEEFEYDPSLYPQRVGRLQRIVDIQFNFNDGRRGGGGFGRGRGRGPRPGGDNRGPRPDGDNRGPRPGGDNRGPRPGGDNRGPYTEGERQPRQQRNFGDRQQKRSTPNALKVDDERQFPTLS